MDISAFDVSFAPPSLGYFLRPWNSDTCTMLLLCEKRFLIDKKWIIAARPPLVCEPFLKRTCWSRPWSLLVKYQKQRSSTLSESILLPLISTHPALLFNQLELYQKYRSYHHWLFILHLQFHSHTQACTCMLLHAQNGLLVV